MKEGLDDKVEEASRDNSRHTASEHGWSTNMKHQAQQPSGSQQQLQAAQQEREEGRKEKSEKVEGEEWETVVAKGRKGQRERGQEGRRKEREREPEVKKDVTDRTVVTRNRRQRKMIQIFVRVNGSKATPMEVNLTDDKVEDVMRRIQNDEDAYVTVHGRVLKRGEKLKSCEVTDGCTMQVTSRLRGGGKHKDKKSRDEKKQAASTKKTEQKFGEETKKSDKEAMIRMMEENEASRKMIDSMSEGSEVEMEEKMRFCLTQFQQLLGWSKEQMEQLERRIRRTVEEKRRGRVSEKTEQGQDKKVHFGEEEPLEETQAESTDEPKMMSRSEEVRIGRGSACLVQRTDEKCLTNETSRKGKGKGNGGKGEHGRKGGEGNKRAMHVENFAMDEDQENMRGDDKRGELRGGCEEVSRDGAEGRSRGRDDAEGRNGTRRAARPSGA